MGRSAIVVSMDTTEKYGICPYCMGGYKLTPHPISGELVLDYHFLCCDEPCWGSLEKPTKECSKKDRPSPCRSIKKGGINARF